MSLSAEEAYNDYLVEGEDGLKKEDAVKALYDMGKNPTYMQIAHFWEENQKGDKDCLTVAELQCLYDSLGDAVAVLEDAFKVFDKDGSESISKDELTQILKQADTVESGIGTMDDMITDIFNTADTDGNGELNLQEFINMIVSGQSGFSNEPIVGQD